MKTQQQGTMISTQRAIDVQMLAHAYELERVYDIYLREERTHTSLRGRMGGERHLGRRRSQRHGT